MGERQEGRFWECHQAINITIPKHPIDLNQNSLSIITIEMNPTRSAYVACF